MILDLGGRFVDLGPCGRFVILDTGGRFVILNLSNRFVSWTQVAGLGFGTLVADF